MVLSFLLFLIIYFFCEENKSDLEKIYMCTHSISGTSMNEYFFASFSNVYPSAKFPVSWSHPPMLFIASFFISSCSVSTFCTFTGMPVSICGGFPFSGGRGPRCIILHIEKATVSGVFSSAFSIFSK